MSARVIPQEAIARQIQASDPGASVFVSANAGAGKTHVLVQRVIRLLLAGVPPEKILCITFTKAAAANMAQRVFATLGHWITLADDALDAAIRSTGIAQPDAALRRRARELFAGALETPGGLKVQTIHALCTRLLQQFPFEANVPAHFAVLDDRDQAEMMERASLAVLLKAAAEPDSKAGRALAVAMTSAADTTFRDVVRDACMSRDTFLAWIDRAGSADAAMAELSAALGVAPQLDAASIDRAFLDGPHLPRSEWANAATIFASGSANDGKQAQRLRNALALTGEAQIEAYLAVFFTGEMERRKSLATKKIAESYPEFCATLADEAERVAQLLAQRRAVAARDRTEALLVIASAVASAIRRDKQQRGLLDYDDLIDKTLEMLDRISSGWVHYKLDRGVDHVLIDEAQDTSPRQWDIIERLIAEFTAGAGARDGLKRTIFAVGDEKQSIFSFQGAVPREFAERRGALQSRFRKAELSFEKVNFNYSFRSGAAILQSVDYVFRDQEIFRSIHADDGYPVHQALGDAGPSLVELWELQQPDKREDMEGWQAPFDAVAETSPEVKLARRVEAEIARLIRDGTLTGPVGNRRRLRYGDVLILVRRRGRAFDAVIQALKRGNIPVAGADRLKLTEHIAVIDLLNLADALLLPQDDLALATVLKSPLFGLDDDDLFELAWDRQGSLRQALDARADDNPKWQRARQRLEACAARARSEAPFSFYTWLLGGDGGRADMLRRLGPEATDALDEFLELALSYERKAPATLQGFVGWLRSADTEIKRDMEIARDEVRVMTVHGAKGLEAPVVFMIDTTSAPADNARLNLIELARGNAAPGAAGVVVWAGRKSDDPPAVAAAREAMLRDTEDEYRRLLYVAMTRAADRLIVGGCMPGNRKEVREASWYDLICKGLERSGLPMQELTTDDGVVKRFGEIAEAAGTPETTAEPPEQPAELPAWLRSTVPPFVPKLRMLQPSVAELDAIRAAQHGGDADPARLRARQRGVLVHRLLQSLPEIAAPRRQEAASAYLARHVDAQLWPPAEREALTARVLALLDDARFSAVFGPGSRAEVPIVGRLPHSGGGPALLVSGQVDRLVVADDTVLIVDFKTNQTPPPSPAEVPAGYRRQLALYRAVLAKLYPQRAVRAALLWTETPEMMEISEAALEQEASAIMSR